MIHHCLGEAVALLRSLNIRDARQLKVFIVQLQRYFREQAQEWISG